MPKRIQRKRSKGWRLPVGAACVTRPGAFGNPFSSRSGLTPEDAVELYRKWLSGEIDEGDELTMPDGSVVDVPARPDVERLRGKDLACFCRLDRPCHADVLLELANAG